MLISVVAVALGCLSYNLSTNDDIISALQIDDMVMYNGQRYRWKGTRVEYGRLCMVIEQDGKGKKRVKCSGTFLWRRIST